MAYKFLLTVLLVGCLCSVASAQNASPIRFSNPTGLPKSTGYSQLVEVDLGTASMILISGQVPLDAAGNVVGKNDPKIQFDQIFKNIKAAVESVNGTMDNVVKLTYFVRDVAHLPAVREARDKYINRQTPPASTAVEVSNLYRPDILGEIEATVIIPKAK